jgi:hypothetical protein
MNDERADHSIWTSLRSREPNLLARLGVSLFAAIILASLATLGAWAWAGLAGGRDVREEELAIAFLVALSIWLGALYWIWGRVRRARLLVWPIIRTIVVGVATAITCALVEEEVRRDDELVMFGVVLIGAGLVVLIWVSALLRLARGRLVIAPDGQVDVRCPACGYRLVGLRDLRCPECGATFTIDELIRAQDYTRPQQPQEAVRPPESAGPASHSE